VGVPGFLRGRRYTAVEGQPKYFNFYETESVATLTSAPYLERLNNPTPWSRRCLANFRNSNRTLCRVSGSFGRGEGVMIATLQISPKPDRADRFREWLTSSTLPQLVERPGLVAAHLLEADEAASRSETAEKSIRDRPDEIADWVIMVEAVDVQAVDEARSTVLSASALVDAGAAAEPHVGVYRFLYGLSETELPEKR